MRCEAKRVLCNAALTVSPSPLQGPEVIIAPVVLAERELLQREAQDTHPAAGDGDSDGHGRGHGRGHGHVDQDTVEEEKAEGVLTEEKEANSGDDAVKKQSEYVLGPHGQTEITPEMMVPSMKMLQRSASSLLRFLVAVSMRQASLAPSIDSARSEEVPSQSSRDKVPTAPGGSRPPVVRGQERSTPKADVGAVVSVLPPTRDRSMYGTPLKQMQTHVDSLHQVSCRPQCFVISM